MTFLVKLLSPIGDPVGTFSPCFTRLSAAFGVCKFAFWKQPSSFSFCDTTLSCYFPLSLPFFWTHLFSLFRELLSSLLLGCHSAFRFCVRTLSFLTPQWSWHISFILIPPIPSRWVKDRKPASLAQSSLWRTNLSVPLGTAHLCLAVPQEHQTQ